MGQEWIPDQVGDDKSGRKGMDSGFHGDGTAVEGWIPSFEGMTHTMWLFQSMVMSSGGRSSSG